MTALRPPAATIVAPPDPDTEPWWDALADGRLILPRCRACGRSWFPPGPVCPSCGAREQEAIEASGRGVLYSWVVVHRPLDPVFADEAPYAVGAVALAEGPRVYGRLLMNREEIRADMAVRMKVRYVEGHPVLCFEPEGRAG